MVLNSVTSTPQWIFQPEAAWGSPLTPPPSSSPPKTPFRSYSAQTRSRARPALRAASIPEFFVPTFIVLVVYNYLDYGQQYADNQNISFLPAIMTTSSRMHGEFLRLLFLQAHCKTTAHFIATGLPSQQNRSDNAFRFKRAAFYMGLKSKVGLVAAKASALRINLNIQGCENSRTSPACSLSRSPSSPPPSFPQYPSPPHSLVRDGQTSSHRPRLVVFRSTCPPFPPPPPREQLCNRYCSNKHTHPNLRGPTLTLWWPGFYQAGKATRVIRLSMRNALKASTLIATSTCSRLLTEFCRASRSTEKKRESTYMAK